MSQAPTAPSAADAGSRVRAQGIFETRALLRNGEQLLVSVILPAMALLGLALTTSPSLGPGRRVDVATAGVFALAVVSTAFTGQAISTGFDRRYGVLRLLGVTPLGRSGLLLGKAIAVASVLVVQILVLGAIALGVGWRPGPGALLPAVITLVLGAASFVSLALLLAGTLRAEAVLALANLIWVVLLGFGLLIPTSELAAPLRGLARALPSGALGDAMRAALVSGSWPWAQWGVLVVWGAVAGFVTSRTFRWSP